MSAQVELSEVAPRDGLQSIGAFVPTETKIALVRASYEAGLRRMEVGSFVSPRAVPQMADTGEVLKVAKQLAGLECTVLVPNRKGFESAMNAGADRLGLFMSATESHNMANLNRTREESFADLAAIVRETPKGTKIRFNLSCVFHCPFEGVVPEQEALDWVERIIALDPDMEIALADTTGNAAPDQVRRVFEHAHAAWGTRFAYHGHDTYGMGLANVTAAWEAGCRIFDAASGGIGGCPFAPGATGNVAMEDVVWLFRRMGVETGVDWAKLLVAADLAAGVPGATPGGAMRRVPAARLAA
ncbi:hydroxymethylglutaryl-CoA lyase [Paracraurococcus ruber]|uniref:Hydroxymethylglutaryl-CoA lyase n=1 Tax=Paracraurococcus ruber TaxID=77675 RepID=A0ABS1D066_9PROT|nr:hydroxymethylglutaryl-CoA lyase [Paracraurococcus ruber]MBK1660194.1 hydroxymethylglutaryl-CoA lyase [Paracraurococcus ruber]TDG26749.1 hydroxymethylglutaryl-CoA lyase [Paracraurococcus ruber]